MKALISTDDYIYRCGGDFFVANSDLADMPMRYLRIFETIRLVARVISIELVPPKYIRLDHPAIEIWEVPCFKGVKQYITHYLSVRRILCGVTDGCSAAVLRMPSNLGSLVWKKITRASLPYGVEVVYDAYDGYKSSSGVEKILWYKIHRNMQSVCFQADGVACVTRQYLQQRYYTKKVDGFASHYSSIALPADFYGTKREFPDNKRFIIAHVASPIVYNGRKGHVELIKALIIIRKEGYDVSVRFAGKGDDASIESLKKLAVEYGVGDCVEFCGFLSKEELRQFLLDADLFVLPTQAEGLPRVIIEAMALGLPCISTDVSGNSELLQPEFLTADYHDVQALAGKVVDLLSNPRLYAAASRYNFENSRQYEQSILQKRRDAFFSGLKKLSI